MDPSQLDDALSRSREPSQATGNFPEELPADFADQVVREGRKRLGERILRRMLIGSSLAAVLLAVMVSFTLALAQERKPEPAPPALTLFQSRGDLPLTSR